MKKRVWLTGLAVLAVLVVVFAFGDKSETEAVDVVNGIQPVSTSFANIRTTTNEMASMTPDQLGAFLQQEHPNLPGGVVYFLRSQGKLPLGTEVECVEFMYGSMQNVLAESGDGNNYTGYFENQILALVYAQGINEPIIVLVQCLNGTFLLPEEEMRENLIALGTYVPQETFTIGQGEGLVHYVPFQVAIDLAAHFDLPLYRGRYFNERNRITPAVACNLETYTDYEQVTVPLLQATSSILST